MADMTTAGTAAERRVDSLSTVEDWEGFFAGFKANLAPMVHPTGRFLSYTEPDPRVHPEQTAWARQMEQGVYMPVQDRVYVAVGYQLCSTTMVVGTDGVIVIDPGENDTSCAVAMAGLRRFSDLPVRAVIYTHRHPDHCFAFKGLGITEEDVRDGRVDVIAHESFQRWLVNDASVLGPILSARSSLAGAAGHRSPAGLVHSALGPSMLPGPTSTVMPTVTVGETSDLELAGVRMTAFHAYGDAQDEIDVWFPDLRHVHGSETVQGETFPNLYTLRGTSYRDFESWYRGVDKLLGYARQAGSYSGSHMRPWTGNDFIVERITNYRDAIQFLHDQCVRYMNKGCTSAELVDLVAKKLPAHLRDDPWLQPYYGTPEHCVREIYAGKLGWYAADPAELAAPGFRERARRYVDALGGRDAIMILSRIAYDQGDDGWAMELLTHVIRLDAGDTDARALKAAAMRRWGFQQKNVYWRGLALGGARELDDSIDYSAQLNLAPPAVIEALPVTKVVEGLRVRLDADKAAAARVTLGFRFTDTGQQCALEIRRGVAVFHDSLPAKVDATLVVTSAVVHELLLGHLVPSQALGEDGITIEGSRETVRTFFGYFEPRTAGPVKLVVR
jgi:alkyl sulfatase BDS1-like metallo-beta-lactamase superfamily hydrolase